MHCNLQHLKKDVWRFFLPSLVLFVCIWWNKVLSQNKTRDGCWLKNSSLRTLFFQLKFINKILDSPMWNFLQSYFCRIETKILSLALLYERCRLFLSYKTAALKKVEHQHTPQNGDNNEVKLKFFFLQQISTNSHSVRQSVIVLMWKLFYTPQSSFCDSWKSNNNNEKRNVDNDDDNTCVYLEKHETARVKEEKGNERHQLKYTTAQRISNVTLAI